jgi:hypothetical protein
MLLVIILIVGCKSLEVESHWAKRPFIADGEIDDWANLSNTYFEESRVSLGLSHDTANLYILFRFQDPQWAQAIRTNGLTLWINTKGKRNKDLGMRYVGGPSVDELKKMMKLGDRIEGGTKQGRRDRIQETDFEVGEKLTAINKDWWYESNDIPVDGSQGPVVAYAKSEGFFIYEFSIPLRETTSDFFGLGAQIGSSISIGAEWGGMNRGDRPHGGMDPSFSGPGGIGSGRSRGGGRGGGRGEMSGSRMRRMEKQEFWVKTRLIGDTEEAK